MPGTQREAASDTVHTCTRTTEGKTMGQTIKRSSSLGFTVNLHHSSIFLPAALNINMDSWGGQDPKLPGVKLVIYAKHTNKAFNWGSLLALGLYRATVPRPTLLTHRASCAGCRTCIILLLILILKPNSDITCESFYIYFLNVCRNESHLKTGSRVVVCCSVYKWWENVSFPKLSLAT